MAEWRQTWSGYRARQDQNVSLHWTKSLRFTPLSLNDSTMHQNVGRAGQARTRPGHGPNFSSESTVYRSLRVHRVSQHPDRPPRRGWRADGHRGARAGAMVQGAGRHPARREGCRAEATGPGAVAPGETRHRRRRRTVIMAA